MTIPEGFDTSQYDSDFFPPDKEDRRLGRHLENRVVLVEAVEKWDSSVEWLYGSDQQIYFNPDGFRGVQPGDLVILRFVGFEENSCGRYEFPMWELISD